MKMKNGFTLAETLITISLIAILASVAMPALNNLKPNQEMLMLKKVYYLTGRMVNELINDDDFYPDADFENQSGFSNVDNQPPAMYHGHTYEGETKFCGLFAARMNVKGETHCDSGITNATVFTPNTPPTANADGSAGHFTTADGVVWVLPINDFDKGGALDAKQTIYVDVNGEKPGNCFAGTANCSKPDRFEIKLDRFGRLYIEDETTRKYLSLMDTTKTYNEIKDIQTTSP